MTDQAAPLYQLASHATSRQSTPSRDGGVIVVAATRPGAGATTMVVNLAHGLSQMGQEIVVVDADLGQPDTTQRLGLPCHPTFPLLRGDMAPCEAVHPLSSGIAVIPGSAQPLSENVDGLRIKSKLAEAAYWLRSNFEWSLVDAGQLDNPAGIQFWRHASHLLLIVDQQTDAVDVYTTIKKLVRDETVNRAVPISILFNRTLMMDNATAKYRGIQRTVQRCLDFEVSLAGYVYENEHPSQVLEQLAQSLCGARTADTGGKKDLTIQLATSDGR